MVGGVKALYAVLLALVLGVGNGKGEPVPEQRAMKNISELNAEAEAYFDWGYNYYSGDGGISQDYAEALKWLLKAADLGHLDVQVILGIMYLNVNGMEPQVGRAGRAHCQKSTDITLVENGQLHHVQVLGGKQIELVIHAPGTDQTITTGPLGKTT